MDESTCMLVILVISVILFSIAVYGNYLKKKELGLITTLDEFFDGYADQIGVMAEQAINIFGIRRSDFESDEAFMQHIISMTTDIVANSMDNFGVDMVKYPASKPIIDTLIYKIVSENLSKYITLSNDLYMIDDTEEDILDPADEIYLDIQKSIKEKIIDMSDKNNS